MSRSLSFRRKCGQRRRLQGCGSTEAPARELQRSCGIAKRTWRGKHAAPEEKIEEKRNALWNNTGWREENLSNEEIRRNETQCNPEAYLNVINNLWRSQPREMKAHLFNEESAETAYSAAAASHAVYQKRENNAEGGWNTINASGMKRSCMKKSVQSQWLWRS